MPGCVLPVEISERLLASSSTPLRSAAGLSRPSESPNDQTPRIYVVVDPFYNSAIDSINAVRVMVSAVHTLMANPMLCPSKDMPETLAALERLLMLMKLALRAYRHTDLVRSLSRAISIGVEECRRLLDELITNLSNFRHVLSNAVLYFIRRYMWATVGWQGSAVCALDWKLRKSHSSLAATLLALGRAAWPELRRGQGQETLDELAKFYRELEQESTSLRHIKVDAVILQDHLRRNLHIPMIFCTSSQDFHVVITGFCKGVAGDVLIQRGDYRILNSEDDQVINPEEFAIVLQPGMAVDMSIVFHEEAEEVQGSKGYSCPRCQHINSRYTGWVTCAYCDCRFSISPEDEFTVSPETEKHVGTGSVPDERSLFHKFSIIQARAQDSDIRLNDLTEMRPEEPQDDMKARDITGTQSGESKADAETREITEANTSPADQASDVSMLASGIEDRESLSGYESQDSQAAPESVSNEGSSAEDSVHPTHIPEHPSRVYARQVFPMRYGYPLYYPEPSDSLPRELRERGTGIGDVGVLKPDGSFQSVFNIFVPADDAINCFGVPAGFRNLELHDRDISRHRRQHDSKSELATMGRYKKSVDIALGANTGDGSTTSAAGFTMSYDIARSSSESALLVLPDGAMSEDYIHIDAIRAYSIAHGRSWYDFINGVLGLKALNGSLYVVTGCNKATAWGIATLAERKRKSEGFSLQFNAKAVAVGPSYSYSWGATGPAVVHSSTTDLDLDPNIEPPQNQCLFIRGFKIMVRERLFNARISNPIVVESITAHSNINDLLRVGKLASPRT